MKKEAEERAEEEAKKNVETPLAVRVIAKIFITTTIRAKFELV